jgi:hypothetical protein
MLPLRNGFPIRRLHSIGWLSAMGLVLEAAGGVLQVLRIHPGQKPTRRHIQHLIPSGLAPNLSLNRTARRRRLRAVRSRPVSSVR